MNNNYTGQKWPGFKQRDLDHAKKLDDVKLIIKDYRLKNTSTLTQYSCVHTNELYNDISGKPDDVRIIGTQRQIFLYYCYMFDVHGWDDQDSWLIEEEDLGEGKLDFYKQLYEKNNFEAVAIQLR